jgi:hypothetical protein
MNAQRKTRICPGILLSRMINLGMLYFQKSKYSRRSGCGSGSLGSEAGH